MFNLVMLILHSAIVYHRLIDNSWWWINWINLLAAGILFKIVMGEINHDR